MVDRWKCVGRKRQRGRQIMEICEMDRVRIPVRVVVSRVTVRKVSKGRKDSERSKGGEGSWSKKARGVREARGVDENS
jgi:hypothetical protein